MPCCQDGGGVSADGRRMLLLAASAGRWGLWLSRRSGSRACCGSCAGRPGIHAIGGMAGVGKTTFAVHAAHRLAGRAAGPAGGRGRAELEPWRSQSLRVQPG